MILIGFIQIYPYFDSQTAVSNTMQPVNYIIEGTLPILVQSPLIMDLLRTIYDYYSTSESTIKLLHTFDDLWRYCQPNL